MNTSPTRTRKNVIRGVVAAFAIGMLPTAVGATAEATPYCGIHWGSLAKSSAPMVAGPITDVRSGRHACFDRLVLDVDGRAPGYSVKYVNNVYQDGSGALVPLRGGAKLRVIVKAPAYDNCGGATLPSSRNLVNVDGYRTFRQVASAGSFEGQTTIGLGVRARLPFRVFTLQDDGTSRLVIDVAHSW